jgi:hypothetical protein
MSCLRSPRTGRPTRNVPVDFSISGSPRPVSAEAGLADYRTAHDALTNPSKHATSRPTSGSPWGCWRWTFAFPKFKWAAYTKAPVRSTITPTGANVIGYLSSAPDRDRLAERPAPDSVTTFRASGLTPTPATARQRRSPSGGLQAPYRWPEGPAVAMLGEQALDGGAKLGV